jgi:hypothetical protein
MKQPFPCKLIATEAMRSNDEGRDFANRRRTEGRDIATRLSPLQALTLSNRATDDGQRQ